MIYALVVLVGGYWVARALQPDREARVLFDDRAPHKRFFLATLMALTLLFGLMVHQRTLGSGAALAWLIAIIGWVSFVRIVLARLAPAPLPAVRPFGRRSEKPELRKPARRLQPAQLAEPARPPQPGALALRHERTSSSSGREADEIYRRAMLRPDPPAVSTRTSPRAPRAAPRPCKPTYSARPNPAYYRLHCKRCGSVLTRPMREYHPQDASRGNFRTGLMIAPGSPTRPSQVDILPGDAENACFFSQAVLDQAAVPLTWNTNSEGCCGPEARGGPNVLCHGCGAWALFYNETCYSPRFFAGRPAEAELRECDPRERFTRQAPSHDKEHWRKVALEQPGVIELAEVTNRVVALYRPRFEAAGKPLDTRWARGGAAKVDPDVLFEALCLLLEHALEVSAGVRLDAHVGGRGVMIRVLCAAPVDSDALETVPPRAAACLRSLGGRLHCSSFQDGELQMVADIAREPIPLKPVSP